MNKNVLLFILLSAAFGLGAVYIAKSWLDENRAVNVQKGFVQVVKVTTPIGTGTIINTKNIALVSVPEEMVPQGAITSLEDAKGMVAKQRLFPGDLLHSQRVSKKGEGSTLASLIGENMRAVSIRVNDVIGVSGFILPGNHVDILTTFQSKGGPSTEVVLSNIKILAVDQRASTDEGKPQIVRAVTVEVSLPQAETLLSATRKGALQLALRNPNNKKTNQEDLKMYAAQPKVLPTKNVDMDIKEKITKKKAQPINRKVEVIRGVVKETISVSI
ncbi:Flp pilus assembly protein CpaB [Thalassotalea aquiviva]|uniref:Flp pilus assembly protein CpaB n=1 Tax=Thalassotalea aquiviva TaxID=3242415 RepID=UPI00352A4CD4